MNKEVKKKIIQYIKLKDPKGDLVSEIKPNAEYTKGKITYNKDKIILHRNISQLKDEEYIRAYLVVKLAKELKYSSDCIELEKEYEAGRPKTMKARKNVNGSNGAARFRKATG